MHINDVFSWAVEDRFLTGNIDQLDYQNIQVNHVDGTSHQKRVLIDRNTNNIYTQDAPATLVGKQIGILFGNPAHMVATMVVNAVRIPFDIIKHTVDSIQSGNFEHTFAEITSDVYDNIWRIARSPLYALSIEFAALKGIVLSVCNPKYAIESKVIIGELERNWNHGFSRTSDFRYYSQHHDLSRIRTFFLAFCFQPLGNLSERLPDSRPHYQIV